ncbi:hypothetical protein D3C73_881990 [compost metagenome]
MTSHDFAIEGDQVEPADGPGDPEHLLRGKLRRMRALSSRGIRAQKIAVGHFDVFVRQRLTHLVQRPVLADAAAQFAVVASGDVLQGTPQGHNGTQVDRHVQGARGRYFADDHHMTRRRGLYFLLLHLAVDQGLATDQQLGHVPPVFAAHVENLVRALMLQPKPGNFPTP